MSLLDNFKREIAELGNPPELLTALKAYEKEADLADVLLKYKQKLARDIRKK